MTERAKTLTSCLLLLSTAVIWGFSMAFQQKVSQYLEPFTCNALRFAIASLVLCPVTLLTNKKNHVSFHKKDFSGGLAVSLMLFAAALCQQAGLSYTTAGKAGFITSLYVVLVPVLGLFLGHKTPKWTWIALLAALPGLYFLCVPKGESFVFSKGDLWMLLSAFFWAGHILCTDHFSPATTPFKLCLLQFAFASVFNFICAMLWENISLQNILMVIFPLLYCGAVSNGVGFLLQTIGQKHARPAHTALILSLESVFSMIGGMVILHEIMSPRGYLGCALMLMSVLLSQMSLFKKENAAQSSPVQSL